jgi:hypothetical protein
VDARLLPSGRVGRPSAEFILGRAEGATRGLGPPSPASRRRDRLKSLSRNEGRISAEVSSMTFGPRLRCGVKARTAIRAKAAVTGG